MMVYEEHIKMANYLATLLGENTEVVLHDFSNLEHSIVYIVNGRITNREIGDTVTDLLLDFLNKKKRIPEGFLCNYTSKSVNGKKLYSSTYFILDDEENLIGALCTNTDYSDFNEAVTLLKNFLPNSTAIGIDTPKQQEPVIENFYSNHETLTLDKIHEEIEKLNIPPLRMTPEEKMTVVTSLYEMGMFMLKGAVQATAIQLETSEATIYRYIRNAKNQ